MHARTHAGTHTQAYHCIDYSSVGRVSSCVTTPSTQERDGVERIIKATETTTRVCVRTLVCRSYVHACVCLYVTERIIKIYRGLSMD